MVLRSVGVLSCGKMMGILYACMGLLIGLFFGLFSLIGLAIPQQQNAGNPMPFLIGGGLFMIILLPVMYGIMGFIGGIIMAALYNLVAGIIGGLELDLDPGEPDYLRQ